MDRATGRVDTTSKYNDPSSNSHILLCIPCPLYVLSFLIRAHYSGLCLHGPHGEQDSSEIKGGIPIRDHLGHFRKEACYNSRNRVGYQSELSDLSPKFSES